MGDFQDRAVTVRLTTCHDDVTGLGVWAAVLSYGHHHREITGRDQATSRDRLSLTAAVAALEALTRPATVQVHTSSRYLLDGHSDGRQGTNTELWTRLKALTERHTVSWVRFYDTECTTNSDADQSDRDTVHSSRQRVPPPRALVADDTDRCIHDMLAEWCDLCVPPPPGVLRHGYRTRGGAAYHNDPDCDWLLRGQDFAHKQGKNNHGIDPVSWYTLPPGQLAPCEACCTVQWVRRHRP